MAGARISIEVDDQAALAEIARLAARLANPARAMRDIGEYMVRATDDRYRREVTPEGARWAENSDVTLLSYLKRKKGLSKRRTASGGRTLTQRGARALGAKKILRDSGALQDTIRYQLTDSGLGVQIGTNRKYGAMQQFGGTKAQWPHLWGNIPARPFLGFSSTDRAEILFILRRHLAREQG